MSEPPDGEDQVAAIPESWEAVGDRFDKFFNENPRAIRGEVKAGAAILEPWGDRTLAIPVAEADDALVDALSAVYLPPQLTALWHRESRALEVIWGPLPSDTRLRTRRFRLEFEGSVHHCEYGDSSSELLAIAKAIQLARPASGTNYRNTSVYRAWFRAREEDPENELAATIPTSFWVRDVSWDETYVLELVRYLNFYMAYFDPTSPQILVHADEDAPRVRLNRPEQLQDFPEAIATAQLDPYLLGLWESAQNSGDPFRRFLHLYQILEYAAFYHLEASLAQRAQRILREPDAVAASDRTVRRILDVLAEDRRRDEAKIVALMNEVVDPDRVWLHIEPNVDRFVSSVVFDGGFELAPLVREGWTVDEWRAHWIPSYPDSLRKIRNALVHGREQRMAAVIAPSADNLRRLVPWLPSLNGAVMQVMLYAS